MSRSGGPLSDESLIDIARYCESLRVLQLYRATVWGKLARDVLKNRYTHAHTDTHTTDGQPATSLTCNCSYPHIQVHIYDIEVNPAELTEQRNALRKVLSAHWTKELVVRVPT